MFIIYLLKRPDLYLQLLIINPSTLLYTLLHLVNSVIALMIRVAEEVLPMPISPKPIQLQTVLCNLFTMVPFDDL